MFMKMDTNNIELMYITYVQTFHSLLIQYLKKMMRMTLKIRFFGGINILILRSK